MPSDRDLDAELVEARERASSTLRVAIRAGYNAYPERAIPWLAAEVNALRLVLEQGQRDADRRHDEQMVMLGEIAAPLARAAHEDWDEASNRIWRRATDAVAALTDTEGRKPVSVEGGHSPSGAATDKGGESNG